MDSQRLEKWMAQARAGKLPIVGQVDARVLEGIRRPSSIAIFLADSDGERCIGIALPTIEQARALASMIQDAIDEAEDPHAITLP